MVTTSYRYLTTPSELFSILVGKLNFLCRNTIAIALFSYIEILQHFMTHSFTDKIYASRSILRRKYVLSICKSVGVS